MKHRTTHTLTTGSLLLVLTTSSAAQAEEVYPRILAGGVSGSEALAIPENSDKYRANGGGLYIHAMGWSPLEEAQRVATLANFAGNDVAVEIGFTTAYCTWYRDKVQKRGVRAKFITMNAFSKARVPTVSEWTDMIAYCRKKGVDPRTKILATFEYANFSTHEETLAQNKVSQRSDFQQIIAASGGLLIDVPPRIFDTYVDAYRAWVLDAIQWTRAHGHMAVVLMSPNSSGTAYPDYVEAFVAELHDAGALPNVFAVANYSSAEPPEYLNPVGSEDLPLTQLGQAYALQTQYLPALLGRPDRDGDGKTAAQEAALHRSNYDASDFAFGFDAAANLEGWSGTHVSGLVVSGGSLRGKTTTADARVSRGDVYFDGGQTTNLLIKLKASHAGSVQVYWATDNKPISASNVKQAGYGSAGAWKVLNIPMADHENWKNRSISALRIDPISIANASFEIDWILGSDGDADHDTIPDSVEGFVDTNEDGVEDALDDDSDGDGLKDGREQVTGRDHLLASDMYFGGATSLAGSAEGWIPTNIKDFKPGSGWLLRGTSTTGDPQIKHRGFHFAGSQVNKIQVYLKADKAFAVQMFWGIEGDDTFTANRVRNANYTTPGSWQLVTFDMSANVAWTKEVIQSIRIDPTNLANQSFEIGHIQANP
jgi:hypothetical protein